MTEIKPVLLEKHDIENRNETLAVAFIGVHGFHDSVSRMKFDEFLIDSPSAIVPFLLVTLMEDTERALSEKFDFKTEINVK